MENFLSIFEQKEEVKIDEEKLRFLATKVDIWDHFGITRSQQLSLDTDQKTKMLKEYYKKLVAVYFGDGKKNAFCCLDCAWFDDGRKQDCLRCGVNVMACSCYEFSSSPKHTSEKLSMQDVEVMFKKREEDLFGRENGVKSGFYSKDLHNLTMSKKYFRY